MTSPLTSEQLEHLWEEVPEPTLQRTPAAPQSDGPPLFRRWTAAELLDADRTFRWLVRGLLVRPTYGFLGGDKKTLKSYVDTFITVGVATGTSIFGRFVVDEPAPVVVYVGEGGRIPYTRRLERVAAAMGVDPRGVPLHPSFDVAPVGSETFRCSLQRDLEEVRPGLVTLDPLYAFHGTTTNASNLYEEGALLTAMSEPCLAAGASLVVVSHFNKSGTGRGLDRITQAGGQEWSDTWLLLSHREAPDVANGRFFLLFEVGSRQWGGTTWELDMELGRFDVDMGEFDGAITWDLRRHSGAANDDEQRVLDLVSAHPGEFTKEELAKSLGGNAQRARALVATLEARGEIRVHMTTRTRSDGKPNKVWTFHPGELASEAGRSETEAGPEW